jgi:hypothetical protein
MGLWAKRVLGDLVSPNSTNRAKTGVKRSLLVEADGGGPLAVVPGANVRHDEPLEATLVAAVVEHPKPTKESPRTCVWTRAMNNRPTRELVEGRNYVPHI